MGRFGEEATTNVGRLFIGNLATERTDEKEVRDLFSKYGQVKDVMMRRSYAFVTYEEPNAKESAEAALVEHGTNYKGLVLTVQLAGPPRERRDRPGRGPPGVRESSRMDPFAGRGPRRSPSPRGRELPVRRGPPPPSNDPVDLMVVMVAGGILEYAEWIVDQFRRDQPNRYVEIISILRRDLQDNLDAARHRGAAVAVIVGRKDERLRTATLYSWQRDQRDGHQLDALPVREAIGRSIDAFGPPPDPGMPPPPSHLHPHPVGGGGGGYIPPSHPPPVPEPAPPAAAAQPALDPVLIPLIQSLPPAVAGQMLQLLSSGTVPPAQVATLIAAAAAASNSAAAPAGSVPPPLPPVAAPAPAPVSTNAALQSLLAASRAQVPHAAPVATSSAPPTSVAPAPAGGTGGSGNDTALQNLLALLARKNAPNVKPDATTRHSFSGTQS